MWYKSLIWIIAPSLIYFSMFQCKHTIKFKKNRTFLHCHKIELGVKKLKLFVFELLFCLFFQSSFLQVNYFLSNQIYPPINCGLSLAISIAWQWVFDCVLTLGTDYRMSESDRVSYQFSKLQIFINSWAKKIKKNWNAFQSHGLCKVL